MSWLERASRLDRRILFLLLAVSVVLPVLFPLGLTAEPRQPVKDAYHFIDTLEAGSYVLMSFDYGPATRVECEPMAVAMLHQCFRRDLKVVCIALDPAGQALARMAVKPVASEYHTKEGTDWVNLGYKAGNEAVLVSLGLDLKGTFPVDSHGTPVDDLPLMDKVRGLSDFALAITYSVGRPGALEHIRLTHSAYGRPLIVGCTAVTVGEYYTYYASHQVVGMLGGLRGAAEYESLVGYRGPAQIGMDAQSSAHLMLAAFILFSNLVYFAQRWERSRR